MKDNELQELFAAKRTTEANRRRQEKLAAMIEAQTPTRKSHHLWPIWAASAAASIAALLMITPTLFRDEPTMPLMLAQVQEITPESIEIKKESNSRTSRSCESSCSSHTSFTSTTRETSVAGETRIEAAALPVIEEIHPSEMADEIITPAPQQPSPTPQKRVHRRTSTRMVSTENAATTIKRSYLKAVADAVCQEESNTITLHTIDLS